MTRIPPENKYGDKNFAPGGDNDYHVNYMLYQHRTKHAGFTLIELLVVITIIGLLASVVLSSLNTARQNARDSARLQEARQLMTALELYRNTHGGYPCSGVSLNCATGASGGAAPMIIKNNTGTSRDI